MKVPVIHNFRVTEVRAAVTHVKPEEINHVQWSMHPNVRRTILANNLNRYLQTIGNGNKILSACSVCFHFVFWFVVCWLRVRVLKDDGESARHGDVSTLTVSYELNDVAWSMRGCS